MRFAAQPCVHRTTPIYVTAYVVGPIAPWPVVWVACSAHHPPIPRRQTVVPHREAESRAHSRAAQLPLLPGYCAHPTTHRAGPCTTHTHPHPTAHPYPWVIKAKARAQVKAHGMVHIKGNSYRCIRTSCISKGNRVTAAHVHTLRTTLPLSAEQIEARYRAFNARSGRKELTVRQARAVRRRARRER